MQILRKSLLYSYVMAKSDKNHYFIQLLKKFDYSGDSFFEQFFWTMFF